jgi:hypothetical protein
MTTALSQQRAAHALRHFVISGALWAIYGPNAIVTGPVFTGFALSAGLRESQIAFLAALTGLVGASQALTFYWTRRAPNKRRLAVGLGLCEITSASLPVVLCIFLPLQFRFVAVAGLLFCAYALGHTVSPVFANWMANVIPGEARATYTGRRMFIITLVSAAYLFIASRWLDIAPGDSRFLVVYGVGWAAGILGYLLLALTPFPPMVVEAPPGYAGSLLVPLRERGFVVLTWFMASWTLAMSIAAPFYSIYMLHYLNLTYTRIAVYTNLALVAMLIGYQSVGPLAQRFGCKPMAKLLIVPALLVPVLWAVATTATWYVLVPLACVVSGFAIAGLQVASSALLYKIVPEKRDNSVFFAVLTGFCALGTFAGAMAAGFMKRSLGESTIDAGLLQLSPPQFVFLVSAAAYLVPALLVHMLIEPEAETAVGVLGKFRGNLLALAYNYLLFSLAREGRGRASALRGMGRSHSPLAVGKLSESLADVSPEVRHEAAVALGEAKAREAVPHLVEHLADEGSDIRAEAALALGQIGAPESIEPLRFALTDSDPRVRTSAALALGEIGGDVARQLLVEALDGPFDPSVFPALVDAAGRAGDLRVVELGIARLPEFASPVLRMQIVNGVCRALGERNHFYKLVTRRGLDRSGMTEGMMRRIVRLFRRASCLSPGDREALVVLAVAVADALDADAHGEMAAQARALAEQVRGLSEAGIVSQTAATGIVRYIDQVAPEALGDEGVVFVVIALTSLARHLGRGTAEGGRED